MTINEMNEAKPEVGYDSYGNSYVTKSDRLCDCISFCIGDNTKKNKWAIPDLQRNFVWTQKQILLLLDSFFKGWPFGTLTLLNIDLKRPLGIAFRGFIQKKYQNDEEKNSRYSIPLLEEMDDDNDLFLILDGQQRLQSLSMALGDDAAGYISDENDWMWEMGVSHRKIRNRDYQTCPPAYVFLDPEALASSYTKNNYQLTQIDYFDDKVIVWGISDSKFQSEYYQQNRLQQALQRKQDDKGETRLIRLSKIWKYTGECGIIDETSMTKQLVNWHFPAERSSELLPSMIAFSRRLAQLRNTPVCRLELLPPDKSISDDQYSNIIVNIFTRLNKGGKPLTPEDITFAWLKRGWDESSAKADAKTCFRTLKERCDSLHQHFAINELIIMSSFVWAIAGGGKIIRNDDLINSEILQELTKWLSSSWQSFADTTSAVSEELNQHGICYHKQFKTFSVFAVWVASRLIISEGFNAITSTHDRAEYDDKTKGFMNTIFERFFICSQWSGYWSNRLETFVKNLNTDESMQLDPIAKGYKLVGLLKDAIKNISEIACRRIDEVNAVNRSQVVRYHSFLWVWHHLSKERLNVWKQYMDDTTKTTHVDHSLAFAWWLKLLDKEADKMTKTEYDEAEKFINTLGNCILLNSDYNCSKSDTPFREYFRWFLPENESKLLLKPCMTAPRTQQKDNLIQKIGEAMKERELEIRRELKAFANGEPGFSLQN